MTRNKLIRLLKIARRHVGDVTGERLDALIKDIELDGVLNVQASAEIVKSLPTRPLNTYQVYRVEITVRGDRPNIAKQMIRTRLRPFDADVQIEGVDLTRNLGQRRYVFSSLIHTSIELPDPRIDKIMGESFRIFEV